MLTLRAIISETPFGLLAPRASGSLLARRVVALSKLRLLPHVPLQWAQSLQRRSARIGKMGGVASDVTFWVLVSVRLHCRRLQPVRSLVSVRRLFVISGSQSVVPLRRCETFIGGP